MNQADPYRVTATALRALLTVWLGWFAFDEPTTAQATVDSTGTFRVSDRVAITLFPAGDVFQPLAGDPKEIHIFSSVRLGNRSVFDTGFYTGGLGQRFGLLRFGNVQLGASGGILVQFDLLAESFDMLNADFVLGFPITFRKGRFSGRLRPYHQSSHLGDELLVRNPPVRRLNYSYESIELILSVDAGRFRGYAGGELLADREYGDRSPTGLLHFGGEVRSAAWRWDIGPWGRARLFGSVDVRSFQDLDWEPGYSLRAGLEADLKRPGPFRPRIWHLLLEFDGGLAPYGQFYDRTLRQIGIAVHMRL